MLYIGQIEYKMSKEDKWNKGWLVGEHVDTASTLLDDNFNPVPKIIEFDDKGKHEYMCWDSRKVMFSGVMVQV